VIIICIRKEESMSKELTNQYSKYKDEIVVNELTLVIQTLNAQSDLEQVRDRLVEQLIEIREFVQKN
jgi:hypothetical protein